MAERLVQFNLGQAVQNQLLADGITLEQITYYDQNGITAISNNVNVVPRDEAGNIVLQEAQENPLLIIEPISIKITNQSMLRVLDTQFNYFKFPAKINIEEEPELDLDLDLDFSELNTTTNNINVELKLPVPVDEQGQPNQFVRISTANPTIWFYDFQDSGFKQLPFAGGLQETPNAYTITQSTIDELRNTNKTLKFAIQLQFRTRSNIRTAFRVKLNRNNPKNYREFKSFILYTESSVSGQANSDSNPYGFTVKNYDDDYPVLYMEYYVDMNDIQPGDSYFFTAVSGTPAWSLNGNAYWLVEIADIPGTPGLYGWSNNNTQQNAGIYFIGSDTVLKDELDVNILKKTNSTNQEIQYL